MDEDTIIQLARKQHIYDLGYMARRRRQQRRLRLLIGLLAVLGTATLYLIAIAPQP